MHLEINTSGHEVLKSEKEKRKKECSHTVKMAHSLKVKLWKIPMEQEWTSSGRWVALQVRPPPVPFSCARGGPMSSWHPKPTQFLRPPNSYSSHDSLILNTSQSPNRLGWLGIDQDTCFKGAGVFQRLMVANCCWRSSGFKHRDAICNDFSDR